MVKLLFSFGVSFLFSTDCFAFSCLSTFKAQPSSFGAIGSGTGSGRHEIYRCALRATWDYLERLSPSQLEVQNLSLKREYEWYESFIPTSDSNQSEIMALSRVDNVRFGISGVLKEGALQVPVTGTVYMSYQRINNRFGDYSYTRCWITDEPVCELHYRQIDISYGSGSIVEKGSYIDATGKKYPSPEDVRDRWKY